MKRRSIGYMVVMTLVVSMAFGCGAKKDAATETNTETVTEAEDAETQGADAETETGEAGDYEVQDLD